jgi:outer membrane receptor protein involved in Fe transport
MKTSLYSLSLAFAFLSATAPAMAQEAEKSPPPPTSDKAAPKETEAPKEAAKEEPKAAEQAPANNESPSEAAPGEAAKPEGDAPAAAAPEGEAKATDEVKPEAVSEPVAAAPAAAPDAKVAAQTSPDLSASAASNEALTEADSFHDLSLTDVLNIKLSTGSFLDLDLAHSPMSMTVIDRGKIEVSGARHLGELLGIYVPGLQVMVNKWNGDIWGMRGVAADRNTKIIFLINGVKLNTESRDGAFTETTLGLLGDIERVEVLRGPAGLTYGSGAIAGVVNVVTRKATETAAEATVGYGSWNSMGAEVTSWNELGRKEYLTLSLGHRRSDGHATRVYGNNSWPADSVGNPQGVPADGNTWNTPGNTRISADYQRDNLRIYSRFTRRQQSAGGYFQNDPFPQYGAEIPEDATTNVDGKMIDADHPWAATESYGTNRRLYVVDAFHVDANYEIPIGDDRVFLEAAVMGVTNRTEYETRDKYQIPAVGTKGGTIDDSMGERRYMLGARYRFTPIEKLSSVVGAQLRLDDLGEDLQGYNMHGGVAAHKSISDVLYFNAAAFTENQYDLGMLEIHAGARADYHTRTGTVLNPKVAAVVPYAEDQSVKLIFQTASNYGSADNYEHNWRHFDDQGNVRSEPHLERPEDPISVRIPSTSSDVLHQLEPEKVTSAELATYNRLGAVSLMTSASVSHISNLFAWNQELFRIVNAGSYNVLSLEGEAEYDLEPMNFGASHVFQRPIATDTGSGATYQVAATDIVDNGDGTYDLVTTDEPAKDVRVNSVRDSITADGKNFLNLATNSSKMFATYQVTDYLKLHTNARVLWGLEGRESLYDQDRLNGDNYMNVDTAAIVKWNASAHVSLPSDVTVSLFVNDILGRQQSSRHSLRWQQMAEPSQREVYSADTRFYYVSLTKKL